MRPLNSLAGKLLASGTKVYTTQTKNTNIGLFILLAAWLRRFIVVHRALCIYPFKGP